MRHTSHEVTCARRQYLTVGTHSHLFATGQCPACYWCSRARKTLKTRHCLFPVCYREGASVQLELGCVTQLGNSSFPLPCLLQGRSQHAAEAPLFHPACYWTFIVDRHFFLANSFGKFLTGQIKYTRKLPKRLFRFLGQCPSNGKKLRGQSKRAQRKAHTGRAGPPTVCNFCPMLGPQVGALCILALTGA